jgi:FMN phosphatase YigB (HAD superfamily)
MTEPDATTSRVAVITRTKDRPVLLRRAMESVLGQSFQDWQHVIINDGGSPVVVDLLAAEYAASYRGRLMVIHNSSTGGMQNASNKAIQAAAGDYVTIHDDDDSWDPAFLETCVARLDRLGPSSRVQGVVSHTHWVFEEINAQGCVVELYRQDYPGMETITLADVAGENRFPPIAFLYRRQVHATLGWFNEEFSVLGDWDFNLRFLCQYDIDVIPERLARWHWRQQGGASAYGNSVTAGVAVHKEMEARLFNHYMRRDLESGQAGLGQLMSVSRQIVLLSHKVDELRTRVDQAACTAVATLSQAEHLNRITRDLARLWEAKVWVSRGISVIRERWQATTKSPSTGAGKTIRGELARMVADLKPGDILSLDVFDTALLRLLLKPTDLFVFIEPDVRALLGKPDFPFSQARVAAERVARERYVKSGCEDINLGRIYDVFGELSQASPADTARVLELEIAAERHLCVANPVILEAARAARQNGVRVVFVSDMYLSAEVLRDLLAASGYESPEVFVSADAGKTKHSGALFAEVLQKLGYSPERVFHVGDHPESDDRRPKGMGIRTLHVDRKDYGAVPLADQHIALSGSGRSEVLSSVFTGLARRRMTVAGADGIWERLGYEVAGPVAYAFTRWIAQQSSGHGIRRLFFLARDGYLLEKVFRSCSERWGLGMESIYMYSSRRLLNMARIERLDETTFDFLLTADPFLRVRDFLERIGLSCEVLAAEVAHAGLGLDQVLTTREGFFRSAEQREGMKRLLLGQESRILDMAAKEREKLLVYFGDIGFAPGAVAIVDLGWQASSIRSLQDLLRRQEPDYRLHGYYFGTWAAAAPAVEAGCMLDSFFFHRGHPERRARLLAECVELVEHLFTAPHPTVTGIERAGSRWNPVCGEWETTPAQRECLEVVSRSALAFVEDMLKVEPGLGSHEPPFGYLESVLERVLRHPTRIEAETLGALPHRDSFGGQAPWRYLARVPPMVKAVLKPSSLREAYERAYWKTGFLAQLGPAERTMVID